MSYLDLQCLLMSYKKGMLGLYGLNDHRVYTCKQFYWSNDPTIIANQLDRKPNLEEKGCDIFTAP